MMLTLEFKKLYLHLRTGETKSDDEEPHHVQAVISSQSEIGFRGPSVEGSEKPEWGNK